LADALHGMLPLPSLVIVQLSAVSGGEGDGVGGGICIAA
jgi:hypothetical protein